MSRIAVAAVFALVALGGVAAFRVVRGVGLDPVEQRLVDLMERYRNARSKSEPEAPYLAELLDYEERHRGKEAALNALYHLFLRTQNLVTDAGQSHLSYRIEAANRLPHYASSRLLPRTIKQASNCWDQPQVNAALENLKKHDLPNQTRAALCYYVAEDATSAFEQSQAVRERLAELADGCEPRDSGEAGLLARFSEVLPEASVDRRYEEGIAVLTELAQDPNSPRESGIEVVGATKVIFRAIEDSNQRLYSEKAAATLFRERHLKPGCSPPELSLSLVDDSSWRLADHRGKVVVIQFSFTGCGPCAEMYPDLAAVVDEFGPRVEVLTLLRDEYSEWGRDKVRSGELTWSVAHDGKPGRVTSAWSVKRFPTVYFIGPDGLIAKPRGDSFSEVVKNLLSDNSS